MVTIIIVIVVFTTRKVKDNKNSKRIKTYILKKPSTPIMIPQKPQVAETNKDWLDYYTSLIK
jgi:hypothetical protein